MEINWKIKKYIVGISKSVLGGIFLFSGFIKGMDPFGSIYKIQDYFSYFGLSRFNYLILLLVLGLCAMECMLGTCLLTGVYKRFASVFCFLLMLLLTGFTLFLAIKNPVSDCGCFGDAIILTNWQTFFKNILLLGLSTIALVWGKYAFRLFTPNLSFVLAVYAFIFTICFSLYNYKHLPIVDFLPYKIGTNIPELMNIPPNAKPNQYESRFIYEKGGIKKEFTLDNYPVNDSSWHFVNTINKLIKKGFTPVVNDFVVTSLKGEDVTDSVIKINKYIFLLVSYDIDKANDSNIDKINDLYDYARRFGYYFFAVTASPDDKINQWRDDTGADYNFYRMDETPLKTMLRSNPGVILIKNGTILNKWNSNDIPQGEILNTPLENTWMGKIAKSDEKGHLLNFAGGFILPLLILFIFDFFVERKKVLK